MARGWESKSVEAQIEAAEVRPQGPSPVQMTAAELQRTHQRESLRLSRIRVVHEIETSQNPRYVQMLERALVDLDLKIKDLERPLPPPESAKLVVTVRRRRR